MELKRILVAFNGSAASSAALQWAAGLAEAHHAEIHVVTVRQRPLPAVSVAPGAAMLPDLASLGQRLAEWQDRLVDADLGAKRHLLRISTSVLWGDAAEVLASSATDADLLVLGASRRRRTSRLVRRCLSVAPIAVAVIHEPPPSIATRPQRRSMQSW